MVLVLRLIVFQTSFFTTKNTIVILRTINLIFYLFSMLHRINTNIFCDTYALFCHYDLFTTVFYKRKVVLVSLYLSISITNNFTILLLQHTLSQLAFLRIVNYILSIFVFFVILKKFKFKVQKHTRLSLNCVLSRIVTIKTL